jgi:hypothetical protein
MSAGCRMPNRSSIGSSGLQRAKWLLSAKGQSPDVIEIEPQPFLHWPKTPTRAVPSLPRLVRLATPLPQRQKISRWRLACHIGKPWMSKRASSNSAARSWLLFFGAWVTRWMFSTMPSLRSLARSSGWWKAPSAVRTLSLPARCGATSRARSPVTISNAVVFSDAFRGGRGQARGTAVDVEIVTRFQPWPLLPRGAESGT